MFTHRPTFSSALRLFCVLGLALPSSLPLHAADKLETDPWQDALNVDYTAASRKLEKLHKANPEDLRVAVAHAAALLARDPVTQRNVLKAREVLEKLVSDLSTSETQYRPLALYLLGRIAQDHIEPAQLDTARTVHLALLVSMQVPDAQLEEAAAKVEAYLPTVTADHAERELHSIAGNLRWNVHQDAAAALPHLIAGRELGYEAFYRNSEVDIMIAGLAREIGLGELAAKHYRRFAEAVPRDTRVHTALRLARELEEEARQGNGNDNPSGKLNTNNAEE